MALRFLQDTTYTGTPQRNIRTTTDINLTENILHSAVKTTIPARGKALVDTQISIAVPAGTYGRVAPRSGLGRICISNGKLTDTDFNIL